MKKDNLLGQKFNRLLVIASAEPVGAKKRAAWLCLCDCGIQRIVPSASLKIGDIKSCGCSKLEKRREQSQQTSNAYVNQKYGKLLVLEAYIKQSDKHKRRFLKCLCDCGSIKEIAQHHVVASKTLSCGCAAKEKWDSDNQNLVGTTINSLTITKYLGIFNSKSRFECLCICGKTIEIAGNQLQSGQGQKSCGCLTSSIISKRSTKYEPRIASARNVFFKKPKTIGYANGNLTFEQFLTLSQQNCFYCNSSPSNRYNMFKGKEDILEDRRNNGEFIYNGLDRLDSTKPHNADNVVTCCKTCNLMKRALTEEEFKIHIQKMTAYHLYKISSTELDEAVSLWKSRNTTSFIKGLQSSDI